MFPKMTLAREGVQGSRSESYITSLSIGLEEKGHPRSVKKWPLRRQSRQGAVYESARSTDVIMTQARRSFVLWERPHQKWDITYLSLYAWTTSTEKEDFKFDIFKIKMGIWQSQQNNIQSFLQLVLVSVTWELKQMTQSACFPHVEGSSQKPSSTAWRGGAWLQP